MIPQIDNSNDIQLTTVVLPSRTYKLNLSTTDRITGFTDDIDAIKQSIYHILNVERYSCLIYDNNYGVELEQYIGKNLAFIEATIEGTLKEALTQDNRITNVIVNSVNKTNIDTVLVDFTVETIVGNIIMEVNINV